MLFSANKHGAIKSTNSYHSPVIGLTTCDRVSDGTSVAGHLRVVVFTGTSTGRTPWHCRTKHLQNKPVGIIGLVLH